MGILIFWWLLPNWCDFLPTPCAMGSTIGQKRNETTGRIWQTRIVITKRVWTKTRLIFFKTTIVKTAMGQPKWFKIIQNIESLKWLCNVVHLKLNLSHIFPFEGLTAICCLLLFAAAAAACLLLACCLVAGWLVCLLAGLLAGWRSPAACLLLLACKHFTEKEIIVAVALFGWRDVRAGDTSRQRECVGCSLTIVTVGKWISYELLQKEHPEFHAFFPFSFVQKLCSKSCCFGVSRSCSLVFSSVQKLCSSSCFLVRVPWKLFCFVQKVVVWTVIFLEFPFVQKIVL